MKSIRGLTSVLNTHGRFKYKPAEMEVDHLIIGGGVLGLSIAQRLSRRFPDRSTYLVERHPQAGQETSSRNSEVIHSGLYYPESSLKTKLCIRGRQLLYERCAKYNIPHRKTGKLVVATSEDQIPYIQQLHRKAQRLEWDLPTQLISGDAAREMEPSLSSRVEAALWCPETGIVDSHALMQSLEQDITDGTADANLVYSTKAVRIDPHSDGWVVQLAKSKQHEGDTDSILAKNLINAAGLSAPLILNALQVPAARVPMYFARGSYASYHGHNLKNISHLIYPCPSTTSTAFESLGTHLTIDLNGKVRFGPDLEWLDAQNDDDPDFWTQHLSPNASEIVQMQAEVSDYLAGVELEDLQPDYVGIRPKIISPGSGFQDFVLRQDGGERAKMVSLLGIESPGLTASMAIAGVVVDEMLTSGM